MIFHFIYVVVVCVIFLMTSVYTFPLVDFNSSDKKTRCDNPKNESELNSFLWMLKRDSGPPAYFFGTIHVPYTRVWDYIPENTKLAFDQAENIFFELDLTDPQTMSSLAHCQLLPQGENLSNILPKDIYIRLKKHLEYVKLMLPIWLTADQKDKGIYADYLFNTIAGNWERKRPIWVMLMVNSLTESDIKSREIPVLDLYLAQEAERLNKITGAVERVEEQCVPLNELNFSQVLFALNQTLRQHEVHRLSKSNSYSFTTSDLIHHYNCGDLNAIIFNKDTAQIPSLANASLPPQDLQTAKMIDDYFRMELITKRNERMADRVIKLLEANPKKSFFFAFGAGHFLGNNTVLDRLRQDGYEIIYTHPDEEIPELKLHKKEKSRKSNKLQEKFGNTWFQIDPKSRSWLEQTSMEQGRRKPSNPRQPFNDLWIRMDTPRPSLMQQLADSYNSKETPEATTKYLPLLPHALSTGTTSTSQNIFLTLWICLVLILGQ